MKTAHFLRFDETFSQDLSSAVLSNTTAVRLEYIADRLGE